MGNGMWKVRGQEKGMEGKMGLVSKMKKIK